MSNYQQINGWIVLDKPTGITSAHAVAKVKRLLKPEKIGHAGTLDPLASGILPLALGEATKTVTYMMDASKAYLFKVYWGSETTTDDLEGEVTQRSDARPSSEDVAAILREFIGDIEQTPPNFSAIKVDGKRAYDLARSGEALELKSRKVRVDSLEIQHIDEQSATFICQCGKGTYIRSLARDMGRRLGCLGHVTVLRRLKVGKFTENHAISLEKLEEMVHKGGGFLHPVESSLDDILAIDVTPHQAMLIKQGRFITLSGVADNAAVLLRNDNKPVAMCSISQGVMKPLRVFNL